MKIFLTAKHWHLFLIFFAIPMVIHVFFMATLFSDMISRAPKNPELLEDPFAVLTFLVFDFAALFILALGTFLGWLYSVGTNLQVKLPVGARMNVTWFKVFVLIPPLYLISLLGGVVLIFLGFANGSLHDKSLFTSLLFIVVPLHFFTIFCLFYSFWFVSKSLKMVETQKTDLSFSDYAGEFFLIWLFFIGVWILQPRINNLFEENAEQNQ